MGYRCGEIIYIRENLSEIFFYKQVRKSRAEVVTAQGAKCRNIGVVEGGDKPGLTHVLYHEIDTDDKPPVVSRPYRYDRVKQDIMDYQVEKILKEGSILPIHSTYVSPVVFRRKNNGLPPDNPEAYRFVVDYRKLNAITKYPRYPSPLIEDLISNIPYTKILSSLDLRSVCFQLAVKPSDAQWAVFPIKRTETILLL
ncbi:retrovirus-related Pol polyprotein from transposon 17.6 [Trichonephila clavipes]|nr:retrovirus-related Pol polyprotein from transposon 17.6 [Trichonephila clavipes]